MPPDKLKTLNLRNHNIFSHQICDILLGIPTHKVAWLFGHVILRGHVTN